MLKVEEMKVFDWDSKKMYNDIIFRIIDNQIHVEVEDNGITRELTNYSISYPLLYKVKDGRRICVGDLLKSPDGKVYAVMYNESREYHYLELLRYFEPKRFKSKFEIAGKTWNMEIIGNIYENQDLVEKYGGLE